MDSTRLLAVMPPYRKLDCPPAGPAALLGHSKAHGVSFGFLDLRLLAPDLRSATFNPVGIFGESFVMDVPDLPIILAILGAWDRGESDLLTQLRGEWFETYCNERGLLPRRVATYLRGLDQLASDAFASFADLEFVGFSCWSSNFASTLLAAAKLKRRKRPAFTVAGGPQVTESRNAAMLALRSGLFDAVVLGEGEITLVELHRAWGEGRLGEGVAGALVRGEDGEVIEAAPRKLLRLAQAAEPSFDEMSLPDYRGPSGTLRLPFSLSRGCTDKCSFCSEWVFWQHFRLDEAEAAAERMVRFGRRYGVRDFHFTDSLINGHARRMKAFAEALIAHDAGLKWGGFMRADMDEETAILLKRAGFSYAYIGVESFSNETLDLMNKRRTEHDNLRSIQAFLAAGIPVSIGIIPGFPGDTRERFLWTLGRLAEIADQSPRMFSFNLEPFILSPSQPIYRDLDTLGLRTLGWADRYLELAPGYAELARSIPCTVEGPNQGAERQGQLSLLRILSEQQSGPARRPDDTAVFVERAGLVPVGQLWLCQIKHRGRIRALLLTGEERQDCVALIESGMPNQAPLDQGGFAEFWAGLLRRHVSFYREETQIDGCLFEQRHDEQMLQAAATAVARIGPGQPRAASRACLLYVANGVTGTWVTGPSELEPVWRLAVRGPQSLGDIMAAALALGLSRHKAKEWMNCLLDNGLLRPVGGLREPSLTNHACPSVSDRSLAES